MWIYITILILSFIAAIISRKFKNKTIAVFADLIFGVLLLTVPLEALVIIGEHLMVVGILWFAWYYEDPAKMMAIILRIIGIFLVIFSLFSILGSNPER